jgi:fructosamine-3-kinase
VPDFVKRRADAPPGFFAWEATGLRWLTEAAGTAVVGVRAVDPASIALARIRTVTATHQAAQAFGRSLAVTHAAGASAFGAAPPGWTGDGWIGRQRLPIRPFARWGEFYATDRLLPYARAAHQIGNLSGPALRSVDRVIERLVAGEFDDDTAPARIHGDLWGGNVLYRSAPGGHAEAVLIDPAAHGGHGLTDLAMLALFGTEHLDRVLPAYAEAAGLRPDWPDSIGLHQLHPLLVHAVTHGPGYGLQAGQVATRYT